MIVMALSVSRAKEDEKRIEEREEEDGKIPGRMKCVPSSLF